MVGDAVYARSVHPNETIPFSSFSIYAGNLAFSISLSTVSHSAVGVVGMDVVEVISVIGVIGAIRPNVAFANTSHFYAKVDS